MIRKSIKFLIKIFPFKREIFQFIRLFWSPPEKIFRHLYFHGLFKVNISKDVNFKLFHYGFQIENEIFWKGITGGWERDSLAYWILLSKRATVIFDVGANTGIYSLVSQVVNNTAKIYAFEPVDRVYEKLKRNCEINKFPIQCLPFAVSDRNGVAYIYDTLDDHVLSVTVNKNLHSQHTPIVKKEIRTITLESVILEQNLTTVDLIKIDVETHEPEVLAGMGNFIRKFKPTILIEVLSDDIGSQIERLVNGCGYLYFNLNERGSVRLTEHIHKSDHFNYLLCSHEVAIEIKLLPGQVR